MSACTGLCVGSQPHQFSLPHFLPHASGSLLPARDPETQPLPDLPQLHDCSQSVPTREQVTAAAQGPSPGSNLALPPPLSPRVVAGSIFSLFLPISYDKKPRGQHVACIPSLLLGASSLVNLFCVVGIMAHSLPLAMLGVGTGCTGAVAAGSWDPQGRERRNSNTQAGGGERKMQILAQRLYRISDGFKGEKKLLLGSNCFGFV